MTNLVKLIAVVVVLLGWLAFIGINLSLLALAGGIAVGVFVMVYLCTLWLNRSERG